jgi:hypothetical protein
LGFSGVSTLSGADLERMMAERASGQTGLWRGLSSRRGRDRWRPADAASGGRYRSPNEQPPRLTRVRVPKEMPDGFSANVTFGGHYLSPVPVFKIDGPEAVAYSTAASPTKMGTLKGMGFPRVADERPRLGWFDSRERLLAGPANRIDSIPVRWSVIIARHAAHARCSRHEGASYLGRQPSRRRSGFSPFTPPGLYLRWCQPGRLPYGQLAHDHPSFIDSLSNRSRTHLRHFGPAERSPPQRLLARRTSSTLQVVMCHTPIQRQRAAGTRSS